MIKLDRLVGLLAATALSFGALTTVASPAMADDIYPNAKPNGGGGVLNDNLGVTQNFTGDIEPGTKVYAKITSCTGTNYEGTQAIPTSGYATVLFFFTTKPGPVTHAYYTISAPGKQSYSNNSPIERNITKPESCSGGGSSSSAKSITSEHIKKWSTKKRGYTEATAGKRVKVKKTYLKPAGKGMNVTYRWYAGKKVVDNDRSYKVSKKYAGKTLKMKVTISEAGYKTRSKTVNFGKIKR